VVPLFPGFDTPLGTLKHIVATVAITAVLYHAKKIVEKGARPSRQREWQSPLNLNADHRP
jgi:predicted oxidoreductase